MTGPTICGSHCPVHEHVCQRSPQHQPGICRDRKQKGTESCTWDPEREGVLLNGVARRDLLLAAVQRQGGEWTTGRVKRLYRDAKLTHILRVTIRRDLAGLHADGHLILNDELGRRFYTPKDGPQ